MPAWLLILLAVLATFRLTRLVTTDFLLEPFRGWVDRRFGAESRLAYLANCPWCLSIWFAPAPAAVVIWWPTNRVCLFGLVTLALSAGTGLLASRWDDDL